MMLSPSSFERSNLQLNQISCIELGYRRCISTNPTYHSGDTPYKLRRVIKESGLTLQQNCDHIKSDYAVEITVKNFY